MEIECKHNFYEQLEDLVGEIKDYSYRRYLEVVTDEVEDSVGIMNLAKDLQCRCEAWAVAFEALYWKAESAIEDEKGTTNAAKETITPAQELKIRREILSLLKRATAVSNIVAIERENYTSEALAILKRLWDEE